MYFVNIENRMKIATNDECRQLYSLFNPIPDSTNSWNLRVFAFNTFLNLKNELLSYTRSIRKAVVASARTTEENFTVAYKILESIMFSETAYRPHHWHLSMWFYPGHSCTDQIFTFRN